MALTDSGGRSFAFFLVAARLALEGAQESLEGPSWLALRAVDVDAQTLYGQILGALAEVRRADSLLARRGSAE